MSARSGCAFEPAVDNMSCNTPSQKKGEGQSGRHVDAEESLRLKMAYISQTFDMYRILLDQEFVGTWAARVAVASRTWNRTRRLCGLTVDTVTYECDVPLRVIEEAQRIGERRCSALGFGSFSGNT